MARALREAVTNRFVIVRAPSEGIGNFCECGANPSAKVLLSSDSCIRDAHLFSRGATWNGRPDVAAGIKKQGKHLLW